MSRACGGVPPKPAAMDEISSFKHLATIFPKLYERQLRYSSRLGWLYRDGEIWRPDEQQAMQIARLFCATAARAMRDRRLDTEATVEAVLRLASFEPRMTAAKHGGRLARPWHLRAEA